MPITFTSVQCFGIVMLLVCCVVTSTAEEERKPTYLGAAIGSYVVLNCPLDFPQEIEIPYILLWNKDGEKVFSWYDGVLSAADDYAGRITFLDSGADGYGRGSVNLTAIRETDGGWYQCRVIFPRRTPSSRNNGTWFHLNVDGGALLAIPPVNQTTMEGEKASFPCVTKEMDSFVTWLKDGTPISDLPDLNHRSVQDADGSLSINPTAMGDLGEYQCEVTNGKGDRQTAHAYLNVQYKAKVIYAPREVYLPYGRPAILDCHYRANPPLTNLRWDKDGFLFDPYNVQGVFYRRNGSLFFSKVDESHTGHYTCTPFNELGTEGASPIISVIVQRPPAFTVTPSSLYLRKLGESLEMPCDARDGDGDSRPTIVWIKKDGTPLPKGRYSVQGGNMTIENIQEEDRGLYQCSATNEAATIAAESELMVENATPRAPYNLTANATQNSITLRWAPGYVRPRLEYNIWYRPVDIAEWRTMRILSRRTTEATITNLSPGREYEFMVLSQDKYGDGMFSKALRVFTLPSEAVDADGFRTGLSGLPGFAQIGPPLNMCVEATSEGYVVTWDPPEYGRESLRLYVVRWSQGPQEFLYGSAETKDNYYIVKNLEEDETYTFQVYAMSTNDYQSASSKYVITVPPYRRIRAITIGVCAGLLILAAIVGAVLYARKKWCSLYKEEVDGSDSVKPNKGDS